MIYYVLGFAFNDYKSDVVLIEKNRPEWQKGLLNGVGGKWNGKGESIPEAMVREFKEEAGVYVPEPTWKEFARMGSPGIWICHCYTALLTQGEFNRVDTCESERIVTCPVTIRSGIIKNLTWLIPMALDKFRDSDFKLADIEYGAGRPK